MRYLAYRYFFSCPLVFTTQQTATTTRMISKTFGIVEHNLNLTLSLSMLYRTSVLSDQALMTNGLESRIHQHGAGQSLLQLKVAGPLPSDMNTALQTPASEVTLWEAPNRLKAKMTSSGQLEGSEGSEASKIELSFSQTYSVFNPN